MTYRLPKSRKSNFATEPTCLCPFPTSSCRGLARPAVPPLSGVRLRPSARLGCDNLRGCGLLLTPALRSQQAVAVVTDRHIISEKHDLGHRVGAGLLFLRWHFRHQVNVCNCSSLFVLFGWFGWFWPTTPVVLSDWGWWFWPTTLITIVLVRCSRNFQIPPDFVVKTQAIDIVDVIA